MKLEDVKSAFDCVSDENCQIILELIEDMIDPIDIPEKFEGVASFVAQSDHTPSRQELIMIALNDLIDGFGVEDIPDPGNSNNVLATYVNTGDTYSNTVVYDNERNEVIITTWGGWYEGWIEEQNEENGTVQCGHCSYFTPVASEWSDTICEQCHNNVTKS